MAIDNTEVHHFIKNTHLYLLCTYNDLSVPYFFFSIPLMEFNI